MADNFENIPVDITAEELEERVKKPIDTKATSGSNNLITSGAVYNVKNELNQSIDETNDYIDNEVLETKNYVDNLVADKVVLLEATVRTYADLDALFDNSAYDVDKAIFNLTVSGLGEIYPIVGGSNFIGIISNDILLITNKETADTWIYAEGSNSIEKKDYLPDVAFVEYEGKYTVSTFAELDEILNANSGLNVIYSFTFPEGSEIHNIVKGIDFIATHGLFTDTDSGKVWVYAGGTFTAKNTITKNLVVSTKESLNENFDKNVDFLNISLVGSFTDVPNGQYHCSRVSFANGINGYLLKSISDGNVYLYDRDIETFSRFENEAIVDAEVFSYVSELQAYEFDEGKIYKIFVAAESELANLLGATYGQYWNCIYWVDYSDGNIEYLTLYNLDDGNSGTLDLRHVNYTYHSRNVDQTYNPESENAQSGKAVAEALGNKLSIERILRFDTWDELKSFEFDPKTLYQMRFYGELLLATDSTKHLEIYAGVYFQEDWSPYKEYLSCLNLYTGKSYVFDFSKKQVTYKGDIVIDDFLSNTSSNPVANYVVANAINEINSQFDGLETLLANI